MNFIITPNHTFQFIIFVLANIESCLHLRLFKRRRAVLLMKIFTARRRYALLLRAAQSSFRRAKTPAREEQSSTKHAETTHNPHTGREQSVKTSSANDRDCPFQGCLIIDPSWPTRSYINASHTQTSHTNIAHNIPPSI